MYNRIKYLSSPVEGENHERAARDRYASYGLRYIRSLVRTELPRYVDSSGLMGAEKDALERLSPLHSDGPTATTK